MMNSRRYTMSGKQKLHELVDQLPPSGIEAAAEFLESLVEPPIDPEMLARIDAARQRRSTGIPDEEVLEEFGR
jgi:hypothetical protein